MNTAKAPVRAGKLINVVGDNSCVVTAIGSLPVSNPRIPKSLPPGTVDVVNALFRELQAIFPAWRQAWPSDDALKAAKRSWIKAFIVEKINQLEQIRFGIERCRALGTDFIPSVGKFVSLCLPTPEMLGIPSHDKAFREALLNLHPARRTSRDWSHPAVRHAALQCELHNLADLKSEQASKIFDRAYDITIRRLVQGLPLEDIAVGIGHDSRKTQFEFASEMTERVARELVVRQGVPVDGEVARRQLLRRFGLCSTGADHA